MGGGVGGFPPRRFEEQYHCYSVAYADKADLEKGDKILLPPSAFDTLARLQVDYPMLFQLTAGDRTTHCGVLEFTAEEGCVYIPFWMMQNLLIEEAALVTITNVSLPKATFVKLQPQSVDFLEISNPRAVLEHALRNFSCVTAHDIIQIPYNNKNYHFELKEVKPSPAACIIETDCNVDFDAPVGYKEPEYEPTSARSSACPSPMASSVATSKVSDTGEDDQKPAGVRIVDGKIIRPEEGDSQQTAASEMLVERAGQTGVQRNSAIPEAAPEVDYWALAAGDGARLDGKTPTELKDAEGNKIDVRKLRAEAAARRAADAAAQLSVPSTGKTLAGVEVEAQNPVTGNTASSRKSRVGSKFSRLKTSTTSFQGSVNSFK
jgi:ubiquitin fusion degradation protein 1